MPNWPVYISSISAPMRLSCLTPEQRTFVWICDEKWWLCGRCGCFMIRGQSGFSEILLSSDNKNDLNKIVIEYSQILIDWCELKFILYKVWVPVCEVSRKSYYKQKLYCYTGSTLLRSRPKSPKFSVIEIINDTWHL